MVSHEIYLPFLVSDLGIDASELGIGAFELGIGAFELGIGAFELGRSLNPEQAQVSVNASR